jgi:tellurite resistance protein TehA-like permease
MLKPSPELLLGLVMGIAIWAAVWGYYGFPRYTEAALVLVALGCISAFIWKILQR